MGFGLLALGYIFLNFYMVGADLVGYFVMLFALNKLSKIEKSFKKSVVAVIILIPVGIFNLFGFVDTAFELGFFKNYDYTEQSAYSEDALESNDESVVSSDSSAYDSLSETSNEDLKASETTAPKRKYVPVLEGIFNAIFIFGSLCFHYFFYKSIHALCMKTEAYKMAMKAKRNMTINILFFSVWGLLSAGGASMWAFVAALIYFVILLFNFIYIYSSYATFSFESEDVGDDEDE